MRRIDYYAGMPLCFVFTVLTKLMDSLSPFRRERPENVLFIELSEMGSAVLADPAMRKVRRSLNASLFFLIFARNKASLEILKTVPEKNIFTIRESSFLQLAVDTVHFIIWARKRAVSAVIDLELFSRYSALLTGLSGASHRVGFHSFCNEGLYRGDMLTHRVAYNPHIHIAKNFLALVNALLSTEKEVPYSKTIINDEEIAIPKLIISDIQKSEIRKKIWQKFPTFTPEIHRVVLFNFNAGDMLPQRQWPVEYFSEVAKQLLKAYSDVVILMIGSEEETEKVESLTRNILSDRCINFAGLTSIQELTALYSVSALLLTNDSGPAHFAAATEIPVYVLFGPETPRLYRPLGNATAIYAGLACSPCVSAANHRKTVCRRNLCMQAIKPRAVLDELYKVLE